MFTLPPELSEYSSRVKEMYPNSSEAILKSLSTTSPIALRVNTLKTSDSILIPELESAGFSCISVPALPHAYIVTSEDDQKLSSTPQWRAGKFAIQSLSSQLVSLILNPEPRQLILDACASPGSKTSHLAMLMGDTGNIVANDASWQRLGKLKDVIGMLGVKSVVPVNLPAEVLWRDYENTFDHALVDVPCTMEGRMKLSDSSTYSDWSIRKIKRLSTEQKGILRSVVRCVKPGGTIVYSTCTLAPEENEEVIDWILRKEENLEVLPIDVTDVPRTAALTTWHNDIYDPRVRNSIRILPTGAWEGFFVAKLKKTA